MIRTLRPIFGHLKQVKPIKLSSNLSYCAVNSLLNVKQCELKLNIKKYSANPNDFIAEALVDSNTFEAVCAETLESLCDYFDEIIEQTSHLNTADVTFGVKPFKLNLYFTFTECWI